MDQPGKVANPARGQLNRENNIPLSPCVPENLVSRDGFSRPVPRQPAHPHTQAESGVPGTVFKKVGEGARWAILYTEFDSNYDGANAESLVLPTGIARPTRRALDTHETGTLSTCPLHIDIDSGYGERESHMNWFMVTCKGSTRD